MKTKTIIQYQKKDGKIWLKELGENKDANFVLLAEAPGNERFYASTVKSDLFEKYEKNRLGDVDSIALVKQKGGKEKFLEILFCDGKMLTLKEENYCLLFHFPNHENSSEDCVLVFNYPGMLGKGARYHVFLSDKDEQNAMGIFWLLKEFIFVAGEESNDDAD